MYRRTSDFVKKPAHFVREVEEEIGEEVQKLTGNKLAPAYYLCFFLVVSIAALTVMKDRSREELR